VSLPNSGHTRTTSVWAIPSKLNPSRPSHSEALHGPVVQLREWQLGCGTDQRRSMPAGQPVEVVKPPATRSICWAALVTCKLPAWET
jgi:hypothetical protein